MQQVLRGQASSSNCIVMVSAYPTGFETYTGQFSILASSASLPGANHVASGTDALRASVVQSASGVQLRVYSPAGGTGRLYSVDGKVVCSFVVADGEYGVSLSALRRGRYVLEFREPTGRNRTVVVNAF